MGKIQDLVDETLRIHRFLKASKEILHEIKPVDSSHVVLFDGPPTDPNYFMREQMLHSKHTKENKD
jgi:hypothetical protein